MTRFLKSLAGVLLAAGLLSAMTGVTAFADDSGLPCELMGKNALAQEYETYGNTVNSYLLAIDGGYMRVDADDGLAVTYYDKDLNRLSRKHVSGELPLYGGFYYDGTSYYMVTGQANEEEDDDTEVYRVTKYDKSWNRLGHASVYGGNTVRPFWSGSCRMASDGDTLVIRTCHTMYTASDGKNHQANYTIVVDTSTIGEDPEEAEILCGAPGYVSHSFNQFVLEDEGTFVCMDHGDGHPRAFALNRFDLDKEEGSVSQYNTVEVLAFAGETGENITCASVGGLSQTGSKYVIAGNSSLQTSEEEASLFFRNIFFATVDKSSGNIDFKWITDLDPEKTGDRDSVSTPHLVKVNDDCFCLLWIKGESFNHFWNPTLQYVFCDGDGNLTSEIYSCDGVLSDCAPIVSNGSIIWYVYNEGVVDFYTIPVNQPSALSVKTQPDPHTWVRSGGDDYFYEYTCSVCGETKSIPKSDDPSGDDPSDPDDPPGGDPDDPDDPDYVPEPAPTSITKLVKAKKAVTVKWKKQTFDTTGYQIQYSLKKNFKGAKTVNINKNTTVSKRIKKLKSKKKYFFRIRTVYRDGFDKYYSAWSKAKAVKIK